MKKLAGYILNFHFQTTFSFSENEHAEQDHRRALELIKELKEIKKRNSAPMLRSSIYKQVIQ